MTTYITNINSGNLKEVLTKIKKEDTLIIFHSSNEKQIPIDMITLFSNAKGTVVFKESEDEVEIAFELGKLAAETAKSRANMVILGDSPLFKKISGIIGSGKKPAPSRKKTQPAVKVEEKAVAPVKAAPAPKTSIPKTATESVKKVIEKTTAVKAKKESAPKKPAKKESPVKKDSPEFDKAYDDFTKLMTDLKTDKYNPSECALGVLSAVRLMNEDTSMDFEAALHSSTTVTTAKKFFNNIKKTDINKIVKAAKEVVKYDN